MSVCSYSHLWKKTKTFWGPLWAPAVILPWENERTIVVGSATGQFQGEERSILGKGDPTKDNAGLAPLRKQPEQNGNTSRNLTKL